MGSALIIAGLPVILLLMGVAFGMPTFTTTTNSPPEIAKINSEIEVTTGKSGNDSSKVKEITSAPVATIPALSEEESQCQSAWEKFLIDFGTKYQDDIEFQKRRNIFCDNWKAIQKHNKQFELGIESFKKGINQWSDLTVDEWKEKQRPKPIPKDESTNIKPTNDDHDNLKCQAAWEKFLIDFGAKYRDDIEYETRRNIFCDNWKAIQKHNEKFELGIESFKKGINQWSDLTVEEWKESQRPKFIQGPEFTTIKPPKDDHDSIKCQAAWEKFLIDFKPKYRDDIETKKRRNIFCDNWKAIQKHNEQFELGVESFKKGINQWSDLTVDEWKESQRPKLIALPEITTTKPTSDDNENIKCQSAWEKFLNDFQRKYQDDIEMEKRRNIFCDNWKAIQKHNEQFELEVVSFKKGINQWSDLTVEEWKESQRPKFIHEPEFTTIKPLKDDTIKCQAAWEKFQIDFKPKYQDDIETEKRRNIFCDNWKAIQKHNEKFELGIESFEKGVNQWSDLTIEEWKESQRPKRIPGAEVIITKPTQDDNDNLKCQAAWEKFLIDFGSKYQDDLEFEKRRNIFCDNWKAIQKHNKQFELGTISFKKGVNQWSDLTIEEWKTKQRPIINPQL
ncbi:uncharacterized protein LOC108106686 isoform X2 [Drosophila eugracilis]|uniref:uncharacterized protein LOC108106686 isoform X2 n=1 Tax=Drosophila eugracilis TaxID=29029 RepID=UPI0007E6D949|nr:uncharacterized protein LOC108106686 isoform X2 [Drosophila eugracilis]